MSFSRGAAIERVIRGKRKMTLERIENLALALTAAVALALSGTAMVSIALLVRLLAQFAGTPWHALR